MSGFPDIMIFPSSLRDMVVDYIGSDATIITHLIGDKRAVEISPKLNQTDNDYGLISAARYGSIELVDYYKSKSNILNRNTVECALIEASLDLKPELYKAHIHIIKLLIAKIEYGHYYPVPIDIDRESRVILERIIPQIAYGIGRCGCLEALKYFVSNSSICRGSANKKQFVLKLAEGSGRGSQHDIYTYLITEPNIQNLVTPIQIMWKTLAGAIEGGDIEFMDPTQGSGTCRFMTKIHDELIKTNTPTNDFVIKKNIINSGSVEVFRLVSSWLRLPLTALNYLELLADTVELGHLDLTKYLYSQIKDFLYFGPSIHLVVLRQLKRIISVLWNFSLLIEKLLERNLITFLCSQKALKY